MRSKEEIRQKHLNIYGLSVTKATPVGVAIHNSAYAAMDEYAKEVAVAFLEWNQGKENHSAILRNNPSNTKKFKKEFEKVESFDNLKIYERYNLFIKSLEQ